MTAKDLAGPAVVLALLGLLGSRLMSQVDENEAAINDLDKRQQKLEIIVEQQKQLQAGQRRVNDQLEIILRRITEQEEDE